MAVRARFSQSGPELFDVDPQPRAPREADLLAIHLEPLATEAFLECGQGAAQAGAGALLVALGPQQRREGVPPMALAGHGQVDQQRDGLARVNLNGLAVELDPR